VFPLDYNSRRIDGWTSADAAGMAILPGLVRRDEVYPSQPSPPPIKHAFRVTSNVVYGYVFPASHLANTGSATAPPLGTRLRLKASKVITGYPVHIQRIFQAMKTYGLIVADTGTSMYVQGTYDPLWDNDQLNPYFDDLHASDFDVIQLGWTPANYPILPEGDWCPWHPVPREEFAVYLLRALNSQSYSPPDPSCAGGFPTDVPCPGNQYARWIEQLRDDNRTVDCASGLYCPKNAMTHAQLAACLLRAKHPGMTEPACASTSPFLDLNCSDDWAGWIMQAKAEGLVQGCDATHYCPADAVTRLELEQLLAKSF
jgi:hypothetical protein